MFIDNVTDKLTGNLIGKTKRWKQTPNARIFRPVTAATGQSRAHCRDILSFFSTTTKPGKNIS